MPPDPDYLVIRGSIIYTGLEKVEKANNAFATIPAEEVLRLPHLGPTGRLYEPGCIVIAGEFDIDSGNRTSAIHTLMAAQDDKTIFSAGWNLTQPPPLESLARCYNTPLSVAGD